MQTNAARVIDHTLLRPDAQVADINKLCDEANKYHFHSVCVNPCWISTAAARLAGSEVQVCSVIGFPFGASLPSVKAFETKEAIRNGASEIDMVLNIGQARDGNWSYVTKDIESVVNAARQQEASHDHHVIVKVILETCLLNDDEKVQACKASISAGADFVKTSTGFSTGGATVHDVKLMRETVGPEMGVKASGGIHSRQDFQNMIAAGANRIGASAGITLIQSEE